MLIANESIILRVRTDVSSANMQFREAYSPMLGHSLKQIALVRKVYGRRKDLRRDYEDEQTKQSNEAQHLRSWSREQPRCGRQDYGVPPPAFVFRREALF